MKAASQSRYGPPEVLSVVEVACPAPKPGEVLVRVAATTVTSGDARIRGFRSGGLFWLPMRLMLGILRPRVPIPGMEFSGEVAAVGRGISRFRVGDPVFGMTLRGANAEYLTIRADGLIAPRPDNLGDHEAAAAPFGALSALVFLRDVARLKPGERLLVRGASGAVGVFAVQLGRAAGAHVTAVCSGGNADLVRALGAATVIDHRREDFTAGDADYDVILDTVGAAPVARCLRRLRPGGRYVPIVLAAPDLAWMLITKLGGGRRVLCAIPPNGPDDLAEVAAMLAAETIRPVIGAVMPLNRIVEAHRLADSGRKVGALVVELEAEGAPAP